MSGPVYFALGVIATVTVRYLIWVAACYLSWIPSGQTSEVAARWVVEHAKTGGESRSPQWPTVRKHFLEGKVCAACGQSDQLEAHHVKNFREHRDLELVESNLLALCEHPSRTCHWHFGHNALEWRTCNPHAREDAAQFLERRKHPA